MQRKGANITVMGVVSAIVFFVPAAYWVVLGEVIGKPQETLKSTTVLPGIILSGVLVVALVVTWLVAILRDVNDAITLGGWRALRLTTIALGTAIIAMIVISLHLYPKSLTLSLLLLGPLAITLMFWKKEHLIIVFAIEAVGLVLSLQPGIGFWPSFHGSITATAAVWVGYFVAVSLFPQPQKIHIRR